MFSFLRHFAFSWITSLIILGLILGFVGPAALLITLVLVVIEIVFSFDNAIVNAKILARLSAFWQKMFLTVGIVIAIFGMRVLFPIAIVAVAAHISLADVWHLALNHPHEYANKLHLAHPLIAAFGGAFLMMLALEFFFDEKRQTLWWVNLERNLQKLKAIWLPAAITILLVGILAWLNPDDRGEQVLRAGFLGVMVYVAVQLLTHVFARRQPKGGHLVGWAAFSLFIYLQILDASFSFDGVIGAFAITDKVVLIAAGLGIGALWVRSMTVYMVRRGTLDNYRYLEHGAYYTIFVLAAALLLSLFVAVPDVITGVIGLGIIGSAIVTSRGHKPVKASSHARN